MPATLYQECLDGPATESAAAGRCPVTGSRVSVQGVGGTDALLAARLAAGDDLALAEVFDRFGAAVYGAALRLMTELAARSLPEAAVRAGLREPVNVHLVLTGPGGGTWDVAVGQGPPGPVFVSIVTDAVGFCRLVANRVTPAQLELHITGDSGRAAGVLAAAAALALD